MEKESKMDVKTPSNKPVSTLLHIAVKKSEYHSILELIELRGYDINIRDSDLNTPLHLAAELDSKDILDTLLTKGASVNVVNYLGDTPLHKAAKSTVSGMVENLLRLGASVNKYNNSGYTPFHIAVSMGYREVIKLMLDWGAKVNSIANNKLTPLHIAVTHWNHILAEKLLDRGANVDAKDSGGKSPLHLAADRVDVKMVKLLLSRKANVNAVDREGQSPLHLAAYRWELRVVEMLLNQGSLVNCQDNMGRTALHIATNIRDLTLVNRLLKMGAVTDIYDVNGLTPLHYALKNNYRELISTLISWGVDLCVISEDCNLECISKTKWAQPDQSGYDKVSDDKRKLKEMCLQELEKIKSVKINTTGTKVFCLIDVLDRECRFDMKTCNLFSSAMLLLHLEEAFPLYDKLLRLSLLKMFKRLVFQRKSRVFFDVLNLHCSSRNSTLPKLPIKVREKILGLLSYLDLQNVIVVSENTLRRYKTKTILSVYHPLPLSKLNQLNISKVNK